MSSDGPHTFTYHGVELPYFYHLYNITGLNERMVEIAIAHRWLEGREGRGLEVGNVLGHYALCTHPVWDLYESPAWYQTSQRVVSVDVLDPGPVMFAYDWIISISTIEHTEDPIKAIEILRDLVAPGGSLLVTFPMGVRSELDAMVLGGVRYSENFRFCTLTRDGDGWQQDDQPRWSEYGPWANTVAVLEWEALQ